MTLSVCECALDEGGWLPKVFVNYSGATGRGRPLPLARDPGVSLGLQCFSVFFIVFHCVFEFLRDFRVCVSLVFGGVSGGFQSLCFSRLFLLTMA